MKTILAAAALLLWTTAAHAEVKPIADWQASLPGEKEQPEEPQTTCAQLCPGYSVTTVYCPEGKNLENCPAEGCSYYHRCR